MAKTYTLRSFDGRQQLPQDFTSLAAAKRAAKRIFGWRRIYSAIWQADSEWVRGKDRPEYYSTLAVAEVPSELDHVYCPVIERRSK